MRKPSVLLSSLPPFALFSVLQFLVVGPFVNLTSKMPFSMGFFKKMSTWLNPLVSLIPLVLLMFASSTRHSMASNKHLVASHTIFLLLYVDNIVVTGSDSTHLQQFISLLGGHFDIEDLGPLSYFLGLQVLRKDGTLHINQLKYAHDLLQKANLLNSKLASTPLVAKVLLSVSDGALISNPTEYRELVGSLQYLTLTRPDISFAVNTMAQFMSAPRTSHLVAAKRILRYIKGIIDLGLTFTPQTATARLSACSDADWAGCPDSRRSTTGYVITLGTNLISWCSKKQPTVSRSSTESEYRALYHACAETTWICSLLHELGVRLRFPVQLFCDNLSTTYMVANPVFHARTRHIELDYHYVREKVALGSHQVCFIPSVDQLADLFTKALHRSQLHNLLIAISLSCCKLNCIHVYIISYLK
ncbi:uncharacterized protein LOC110772908 [Prunus avium]|uniref:Uncharacterized protein LOC110772908 n=1 Tax=Prunus avium TaxID=42229 RepID=A0A6P5U167_PRUAV|nr:uncharacterized protein LOC110772908 [Prunus avium]